MATTAATETDSLIASAGGGSNTNRAGSSSSGEDSSSRWWWNHNTSSKRIVVVIIMVGLICFVLGMGLMKVLVVVVDHPSNSTTTTTTTARSKHHDDDANKRSSSSSSSASKKNKYTATQFISFSINTLGGIDKYGECNDDHPVDPEDGLCYLGNVHDLQDDLEHRFAILREVLLTLKEDALQEYPEVDHASHVLKIFMLPEFYLRGPHGAYSAKEFRQHGLLLSIADKVRDLVADPAFTDYFFVLGTVILVESTTTMPDNKKNNNKDSSSDHVMMSWKNLTMSQQGIRKGDILYFNLAPAYRGGGGGGGAGGGGGPINHDDDDANTATTTATTTTHNNNNNNNNSGGGRYIVPKNYISTADFLNRNNGLPDPRQSHLTQYDAFNNELLDYLLHERNVTILENGIVDIDGIRIGIEICLDHRLGVLWHYLQQQQQQQQKSNDSDSNALLPAVIVDEENLLDVLLITSAGMSIERGPNPIRSGGVVYLTDGEASSAACRRTDMGAFDPTVVCRDRYNDGPTGLRHIPVGGPGYSSYIELATCLNPDNAPWKPLLEGYYSNHATQGCAYTLKLHGIDVFDEYDFYPPSIEIYPTIDLPS